MAEEVTPEQIEDLKERIEDIDDWLTDAEEDRSDLEQQLVSTERTISRLTRERRVLNEQVAEQQQRLSELQTQERELTRTLDKQRESLKKQIRAAWMEGDTPAVKVLLNEVSPDNVARTMTYYEYLSQDTVQRLEAFRNSLQQLQQTRASVQATRTKLAKSESDIAERQAQLTQSRKQREQTLASLKADISSRKSERNELESDRKRLQKLLDEVQQAIASIPAPNESEPFRTLRNKLPWPVQGKVVSRYGAPYADGKLRRSGILINTSEDAEVHAIHYGRVVFANWLRGFGLITIIDHGDGYMTLYGHSSSLFTSPGDWVAAGQAIALAGRTGGTSDPALYFEVRHNGKPDNPGRWLAD
ncbi:peptidoglycan DD-metalloendopeptidase family protein [Marinobacter salinexigens]|uniref:Peptidoglycan DD-metalloendopeptidase family protein n=1 Tax=Marinobacter salinexigens TaxID=2919747 RepID=A0A5B0VPT3_9GAMM|nr:peptidoglycan DD-metalloendopeptidase family protein [Marinobacter salinexigens]KAA1176414.1 peptidoglycan DD-metalloendopeptidase family protein [Marinobacter salinexigens]